MADHIYGMFAFAIFDTDENKYFCLRDHFGTKPFYYYITKDNRLLCGTNISRIIGQEGFVKELKYDPSIKSDAEQAKSLVRQYVEILEDSVVKHPLQWFNYYNFWQPIS